MKPTLEEMIDKARVVRVHVSEHAPADQVIAMDMDAAYAPLLSEFGFGSFDWRRPEDKGVLILLCHPEHELVARGLAARANAEKEWARVESFLAGSLSDRGCAE